MRARELEALNRQADRLNAEAADGGLKHASWVMCDTLVSLPKAALTDYVGALGAAKLAALQAALRAALDLG
jgi:mRNA-degrading endonuclease toxin of MazEF toxin-antitoxin module